MFSLNISLVCAQDYVTLSHNHDSHRAGLCGLIAQPRWNREGDSELPLSKRTMQVSLAPSSLKVNASEHAAGIGKSNIINLYKKADKYNINIIFIYKRQQ